MNNLCRPAAGPPARLVFLLQDLKFGGTQRQTLELARLLPASHFQTEIWLLAAGDDLAPWAERNGIPLVWLSRRGQVGPTALVRLWQRFLSRPPDLLMLLTVVPNIWGRLLGRLARVPVIVGNCRGGGAPRRQRERWLWPLAHHLLCNARAIKETLTERYGVPPARITVIPNGVDTDYFQPLTDDDPQGPPAILSVGRLVPEKDQATLIRAFAQLAGAHPQAELWLVGEGPAEPALRQLAGQCLPPGRVRFLPVQADLRPLFGRAGLLALSSVAEAMPNVVLEAMAAGLPVVATRVGGVPEMVSQGETGILVAPGDAPGLAAALSRVLAQADTRREFGRAGRNRVLKDFSLEAMGRRYAEEFDRLLGRLP